MRRIIQIAIDARPLDGTKNGYSSYIEWVVSVLQNAGCNVEFCSNKSVSFSSYKRIHRGKVHIFGSQRNFFWEQRDLRLFLKKKKFDVYFCGQNIGLPLLYFGETRLVLGLLDVIPMVYANHYMRSLRDKIRYKYLQRANAIKADQLITISKASKRDIKKYLHISRVEKVYIRQQKSTLNRVVAKYTTFVYVGGIEWRKRISELVQAFCLYAQEDRQAQLILLGGGYEEVLGGLETDSGTKSRIHITGSINDEERAELISKASAVVFPSLYEGYGLPIAESLVLNVPVICGRGGSQTEVGGDVAVYVDPINVLEIVAALKYVQTNRFKAQFDKRLVRHMDFLCNSDYDKRLISVILGL